MKRRGGVAIAQEGEEGLRHAAQVIRNGGVVILPTDTTFAVAANALSPEALKRVHKLKQRDPTKQMSIMVASVEDVARYAYVDARCLRFIGGVLPGPLTVVLPARESRAPILASGGTIGVRVPSSLFCQNLAKLVDVPLTATSANRAGMPETYTFEDAMSSFAGGTEIPDLVIQGLVGTARQPSTIIDLTKTPPAILRQGVLSERELLEAWCRAGEE